jgi:hypothetical protein
MFVRVETSGEARVVTLSSSKATVSEAVYAFCEKEGFRAELYFNGHLSGFKFWCHPLLNPR